MLVSYNEDGMKRLLFGLLLVSLFVPTLTLAADMRAGSSQSLSSGEVVKDDLYMFGATVIDSGTVEGDVVAAGGTILVAGPVTGTVQVAGGNLSLTGSVGQTVRAAGGVILINGTVGKDVVAAGGTVEIDGAVGRDVVAAGGTVTINAPISGHVDISAQKLVIGSRAVINGTLTYHSPVQAVIDPGAKILGTVHYVATPLPSNQDMQKAFAGFFTLWLLVKFLMTGVCLLLLLWLMKRYTTALVANAFTNPAAVWVKGLATIILLPIVSILCCLTIVGLPIGAFGILCFIASLILSSVVAPLLVGSLVYRWALRSGYETSWKTALLGVVCYAVIGFIPILGWLCQFVFATLAFGAIVTTAWAGVKTLR